MLAPIQEAVIVIICFYLICLLKSPNLSAFHRHTSHIVWCEPNYKVTPLIAEFGNTISAVFFAVVSLIMMYVNRSYAELVNRRVYAVWLLFSFNGAMSAYFHSTLSLMGQLLDEVSIVWGLLAGIAQLWPATFLPAFFAKSRARFLWAIFALNLAFTALCVVKPALNAPVLMISGIGFVGLFMRITFTFYREEKRLALCLALWNLFLYTLAMSFWISDRVHCDFWRRYHFPYLHSLWHFFVCFAGNLLD